MLPGTRRLPRLARSSTPYAGVFVLALAARLSVSLLGGGLGADTGYDPGVYYAGATGLVSGRLPYRDFVFVHPPMIMYVLAPFAWVGRLTSDHAGFVLANVAFAALGGLNAALVVRVARALGLARAAALAGGLFYALWWGAVKAEVSTRLETLGNTLVLLALLALATAERGRRPVLWSLAAGAGLGAAVSTKLWWAAVLLIVLAWQVVIRRAYLRGLWLAAGALALMLLVNLPLLLPSHGRMWHMVVTAQLDRNRLNESVFQRLGFLVTLPSAAPSASSALLHGAAILAAVVAVALAACAWSVPAARPFVVIGAVQVAVLLESPSAFDFYADYLTIASALTLAGATQALLVRGRVGRLRVRPALGAAAVVLPLAVVATLTAASLRFADRFVAEIPHRKQLAAAARHVHCITADEPTLLIQLNALTRSFHGSCPNLVDLTALEMGAGRSVDRIKGRGIGNLVWSQHLEDYLLSGQATIAVRVGIGLTGDARRAIQSGRRLAGEPPWALYLVPPDRRRRPPAF